MMGIPPGTHTFGPDNATLTVRTRKAGPAARAGHDLVLAVGSWTATIEADGNGADGAAISLIADSRSLSVVEASGGIKALNEGDKTTIKQTIDADVLKGCAVEFRSSGIVADGDVARVTGELQLAGRRRPLEFELELGVDGALTGSASVVQSAWGITPYSALFGTLKVGDEVRVVIEAKL